MRWPRKRVAHRSGNLIIFLFPALLIALLHAQGAEAQKRPDSGYYSRVNSFGILAAWSNDSSHMLLGESEQRKLLSFGVSYERRILVNHVVNWMYNGELLPVALESDPLGRIVTQQTEPTAVTAVRDHQPPPVTCAPFTMPYSYSYSDGTTYSGTVTVSCRGREWTVGQAMSPVGFEWNFLPRRRIQPYFVGHGGYMYSSHPIPVDYAGSFNFTFDLGAGLEFYRTRSQSVRIEYRYHHISNHWTSYTNPGIDNGLLQVTYAFGR